MKLKQQIDAAMHLFPDNKDIYSFSKDKLRTLLETAFKEQREICAYEAETKDVGRGYQSYHVIDEDSILTSPDPETGLE